MTICIQKYAVPKERDYDNTLLSLRLTAPEAVRFWKIMDAAKARNPYVGKSDVMRELLGLKPALALLTTEIAYFRKGEHLMTGSDKIIRARSIGEMSDELQSRKTPAKDAARSKRKAAR